MHIAYPAGFPGPKRVAHTHGIRSERGFRERVPFINKITRITGGGSGYAALLAHAGGALCSSKLGSVTLKRIGFFCFPIKHSTHRHLQDQNNSEAG